MLEEEIGRFAGANGKVLLNFLAFLAAEGRVGHDNFHAIFLLNVGEILGKRVGVDDIGRFDAVEDHVHDPDDVGEGFFLFAEEGLFLEGFPILRRKRRVPG